MLPNRSSGVPRLLVKDRVQVAGIRNEEEANMLVRCGVDYLGFPVGVPVHEENVTEADTSRIIHTLEFPGQAVLITYLGRAADVVKLCRFVGASIVQLHGEVELQELQELRALDPNLRVIKSVIIGGGNPLDLSSEITAFADHVDAFITDTFDTSTGARGATGKTHDWKVSRGVVEVSQRPVILAGGLTPDNVRRAIQEVQPAGVDVHTGVENSTGDKSQRLVRRFVLEARDGFSAMP
jgi:phosphoribosylanthranilate isomerase